MEEGASLATGNGAQPLFTQPPPQTLEDEDSSDIIGTNNKDDGACDTNNDIDMDDNDEDGSDEGPIFEVDEEDSRDGPVNQQDDDDDDGFKLLTQANDRFNDNVDSVDSSSSDESSSDDSNSSGDSSDDDDSEGSSSTGEEEMKNDKVETPLQERRARNMRRNKAFVDNLKLELNAMMNQGPPVNGHKSSKRERKVAAEENKDFVTLETDVDEKHAPSERRKRRGMIFSTITSNKRHNKPPPQITNLSLTTKSLVDELNQKYPHRSNQIQVLCSQLVSIVQKSKFAWQMKDNIRSLGNIQYSEASYQGDIKLATPSPIMITGNGGNGKTCIVRDAMTILQQRTNCGNVYPTVANAYIDCASSESGSVAAVMNSAYKQLHECYHSNSGFGRDKKGEAMGYKHHSSAGIARSTLGGENDFTEDVVESDAADDESLGEDQLERQRSRAQKMKETAGRNGKRSKYNTKTNGNATKANTNNTQNVRQTRLRTTLATKAANQPTSQSIGLNSGSIPSATNRNTQNSGSVALFGRATSALIQAGNTTRKRSSHSNWRCVFLILDNAERILSWKKHGSINPLTQIFLLPSVMGINLTLIFISRSTIFQHSRESCI